MSPSARASDSLIARSVRPVCESASARVGRHRVELARQDRVERGQARVAEHVAVALRRVLHPVALGPLGELDQPGGERLGLGRHGRQASRCRPRTSSRRASMSGSPALNWPSALSTQRIACSVSETQPGWRRRRARAAGRATPGCARRSARPAPGGLARGLGDRGQALAHGHDVDRADGGETCTSRRSIEIAVRGERRSRALSGQARPARRPRIRHEQRFPCVHGAHGSL